MSRPLHRILRKAKQHVKVNPQTQALLLLLANEQHLAIAKVIQSWLGDPKHKLKQTHSSIK